MSKEKMLQIAANTANEESENAIYFMKGKVDLESFLSWLENRIKNSSIQISHTFDNNNRMHTYVVKHDNLHNDKETYNKDSIIREPIAFFIGTAMSNKKSN